MGINELADEVNQSVNTNNPNLSIKVNSTSKSGVNKDRIIRQLNRKVSRLENSLNQEKNKPKISVTTADLNDHGSLTVTESVEKGGKTYSNARILSLGDGVKDLAPLIRPIVEITISAVKGKDLTNGKLLHVPDAQGKPTSQVLKDANGRGVRLMSRLDVLKSVMDKLSTDEEFQNASKIISRKFSEVSADFSVKRQIEQKLAKDQSHIGPDTTGIDESLGIV